jgi:TfoX/Sxy family transcriptional regulator of competence genes
MPEKMKWEKASAEMGDVLAAAVSGMPVNKKVMFGAPVYTVNHNMFAGVHGSNIFLRLSDADRRKIASEFDEASPFEPVKGHVMKEYMTVPPALYEDTKLFTAWLKRSFDFTAKLPAKEPKSARNPS